MLISATRLTKKLVSKPRLIKKRCFKNFCENTFIKAVRKINFLDIYLTEDVEEAVDKLTKGITEILDIMAPVKIIQVRNNYLPWMSNVTKKNIQLRNELLKKAKVTSKESNW